MTPEDFVHNGYYLLSLEGFQIVRCKIEEGLAIELIETSVRGDTTLVAYYDPVVGWVDETDRPLEEAFEIHVRKIAL